MNIFRFTGDLSHLIAIIILLQKIWHTRSCAGISGKKSSSVCFSFRDEGTLDLVTTYVSLYNTMMKFVFLATSCTTVYLIYVKFKATYDRNQDTFRISFLIIPAIGLALLINHDFTVLEIIKLVTPFNNITVPDNL
ncbi:hypothetical protein NQ317_008533 [Molorchus minor]|uniref:Uncharacterized protein n=1 Tax=Molorchus minor TaxID=1323400 RepID=A0ABQ9IZV8_9CUCU|nr:hypothetical protein NQ317_008533 [Molorchus minor]